MAARKRDAKRRNWPDYLYKNGAGYFYWRDPMTKENHGLGRDQAKAFSEARAANLAIEQKRGSISLAQKILEPEGKSLSAWADEYEVIYEQTRTTSAASIKTMKAGVRAIRTAPFIDLYLRKITTAAVSSFIEEAIGKRGPNMAALMRRTLADIFREAETKGLIDTGKNPVSVTRKPNIEVGRSRLTLDQFKVIYAAAAEFEPWVARSMELALVTAQRREDISKLKFSDAHDGFLFVCQTKTGARLRIPLSLRLDVLNLTIEEVIKRCRDSVVSKSMLHHARRLSNADRGGMINIDSLTRAFATARDKAQIKWESGKTPATFHEIRSLAARLYADQYGAVFAQTLLGHKSASMTEMYRDSRGAEWVEVKFGGQ